jgi:PKD repeat protein
MKKIYFLAIIISVFLISCDKVPVAHFSIDAVEPEVGQEVHFNNASDDADRYEWDFGDGVVSKAENPTHIFTGTGVFTVTLTAYNGSLESEATMDIEVFIPTLLAVYVYEWNDQLTYDNPIGYASVWLYPTLTDWDNEENVFAEGFTDADGVAAFSNLNNQRYYVDVWSENYNNYTLASEDVGWIETDVIIPHAINWFDAWVDYTGTKGDQVSRRGGSFVIKHIARKSPETVKPVGTESWQILYEKSVKGK